MRSDPKGFNRGSELPVILAFSPKIKVDTHLDNRTHISTDRIYVAYLVGPHKHNRKHTFAIQSNAQANGKMKKKYFLIWTIFTSLHDKNYCTHFSYCLHPSLLSLSRVFWPAAVAANRRALLMKVLKESGKWQRKRKKKNVAPQHPQIQSSGKKEGDSKRQCSFSERALSVFSSSSAPKCWSHKWCWGLRAVPAVCVNSKLKILLTRRYFMCSIFIKWL